MPKTLVHRAETPLHRGFSAFLFNLQGELLLQQRARTKKTWPLVWSNSVCGHPAIGETMEDTACRRARHELGLELDSIKVVVPHYRYKVVKDGVMENEICPILVGAISSEPTINTEEVEATRWISWQDFLAELKTNPHSYSPWCIEETGILQTRNIISSFL